MALKDSFEKSGNWLFRYRSYVPLIILLTIFPVVRNAPNKQYEGLLTLFSIVLSMAGLVVRAYTIGTTPRGTSGRNTQKQVAETLNTTGIYSIVRHPLYLGNFLMWAGLAVFTFNLGYFVIIILVFWIYYERIMFAEEAFLRRKFGQSFEAWSKNVPAILPDFRLYRPTELPFSIKSVLRREYSGVLALAAVYFAVDYFRIWIKGLPIFEWRISAIVFIAALLTALVLRSLKHYTHWLTEEDRS